MFPLRDDNPSRRTALATFLIIGINLAVWFFVQGFGFGVGLEQSVWKFGLVPLHLFRPGADGTDTPVSPLLVATFGGAWPWATLATHMFMHGGWFHILGNLWFLYIFGDNVEDMMGPLRFLVFYLLCGLAAAAAQILAGPGSAIPMVGASGAIGGVMGAYALLFPRAPVHVVIFLGFFFTRAVIPAFLMLGYWFVLQFFGGFFSGGARGGTAFWAHIGGFVMGIALVKLFCDGERVHAGRARRGSTRNIFQRIPRG
jgi:membrane associated rhomboid family serine protease